MSEDRTWCAVCCTRHDNPRDCPGNLLATGPERHAHKFAVAQDKRLEYYGILIAEAGELWRARVFTYPNMLWSVPGGRGTIKFVGTTPREAEDRAIAFLREHCAERHYTMQDASSDTEADGPGRIEEERAPSGEPTRGKEERHPCKLPIRFGREKADRLAKTANLSPGGIYIATTRPVPKGSTLTMFLDVREYTIPLHGTVAWVRNEDEPGRPRGMGVHVHNPPSMYVRYLQEVLDAHAATSETSGA